MERKRAHEYDVSQKSCGGSSGNFSRSQAVTSPPGREYVRAKERAERCDAVISRDGVRVAGKERSSEEEGGVSTDMTESGGEKMDADGHGWARMPHLGRKKVACVVRLTGCTAFVRIDEEKAGRTYNRLFSVLDSVATSQAYYTVVIVFYFHQSIMNSNKLANDMQTGPKIISGVMTVSGASGDERRFCIRLPFGW